MKKTFNPATEISFEQLIALRFVAQKMPYLPHFMLNTQHAGHHLAKDYGRGMEFAEVRAYQAGDDIRHIDWRVTARQDNVYTKLFHVERDRQSFIVVNQSKPMHFATQGCLKSVQAAKVATLLGFAATQAGDRLTAILAKNTSVSHLLPKNGIRTVLAMAKELSQQQPSLDSSESDSFVDSLKLCLQLIHRQSTIILISDFVKLDTKTQMLINRLARGNQLILCQIRDALECEQPPLGIYPVRVQGKELLLDLSSEKRRQAFMNTFEQQQQQLLDFSHQLKSPLWQIDTRDDIVRTVAQLCGS